MKYFSDAQTYQILDVEAVSVQAAAADGALKSFTSPQAQEVPSLAADIAIIGGGMGGIAAALTALTADSGVSVVMTEETSWLGGQMTSQGVSALDENKWVESTGACLSYLQLRDKLRESYRQAGGLTPEAAQDPLLHPGRSWVTRLSFEPARALAVIDQMLAPYIAEGRLTILKRSQIVDAHRREDNRIEALIAVNVENGQFTEICPKTVLDATELGDLFPLVKVPYYTGSDSKRLTNESHAPEQGDSENVQDFTYPFVLTLHAGEDHTIEKPDDYETFKDAGKFSLFGFKMFEHYEGFDPARPENVKNFLPFWTYRRLIDKSLFDGSVYKFDISMINWDANDLRGYNIIDKSPSVRRDYLTLAKRLSLGFLYWLQTEAPRDEGGQGYPEFKLDLTVLGTKDGLAKFPYIREARRLAAKTTIVEEDIVIAANPGVRARSFPDSVGIGHYPVDIHGRQEVEGTAQATRPFQIPYSALVSEHCPNLLACCKNLGVSHITNGSYRLHPIEWAIGVAGGAAAALAVAENIDLNKMADQDATLKKLQTKLIQLGAPLFWLDDIGPKDQQFAEAQLAILNGRVTLSEESLSFPSASALLDHGRSV